MNVKPLPKTVKFLRQNLIYCFQNNVRIGVLETIDKFDLKFFSYEARKQ